MHPDKVRLSLKCYDANPIDFVWAPNTSVGEEFSLAGIGSVEFLDLQVTLSRSALLAPYAPSAAMFRNQFLEVVGNWNESLRRWVDLEYHARIAAKLPLYARLSKPLYFYRQHRGERISNCNPNHSNIQNAIESLTATKATLDRSKISPAVWKSVLWTFYLQLALSSAKRGTRKCF